LVTKRRLALQRRLKILEICRTSKAWTEIENLLKKEGFEFAPGSLDKDIKWLLEKGFLAKVGTLYQTTEEGLEFYSESTGEVVFRRTLTTREAEEIGKNIDILNSKGEIGYLWEREKELIEEIQKTWREKYGFLRRLIDELRGVTNTLIEKNLSRLDSLWAESLAESLELELPKTIDCEFSGPILPSVLALLLYGILYANKGKIPFIDSFTISITFKGFSYAWKKFQEKIRETREEYERKKEEDKALLWFLFEQMISADGFEKFKEKVRTAVEESIKNIENEINEIDEEENVHYILDFLIKRELTE